MLNWVKANRKAMNTGRMKEDRVEAFENLPSQSLFENAF